LEPGFAEEFELDRERGEDSPTEFVFDAREQLRKDVDLVLEYRIAELGYFVGFRGKKAFGQPTVADSIAKPSPWLAEQRHPPFGRSLLGRFGLAGLFYLKRAFYQ